MTTEETGYDLDLGRMGCREVCQAQVTVLSLMAIRGEIRALEAMGYDRASIYYERVTQPKRRPPTQRDLF